MGKPTQDPTYGVVEEMTPQELHAIGLATPTPLAATRPAPQGIPQQPAQPQGFLSRLGTNVKQATQGERPANVPQGPIPAPPTSLALSAVSPGGPLAQMAIQGLLAGGGAALKGQGPLKVAEQAGAAAGGAALGKGTAAPLGKVVSSLDLPAYAEKVGSSIAAKLKDVVPALKSFEPSVAGLKRMLYTSPGYNGVHRAYDKALKAAVKTGEGKVIEVSVDDAKALGLKEWIASVDPKNPLVGVKADQAIEAVTGKWKKDPGVYRRVVDQLDAKGVGDPIARSWYKTWSGFRDYLEGTLGPKGFDILKAQANMTKAKTADKLLRRDMGAELDLLAPGGKTLTKGSLAIPGAVVGALGGAGIPGIGHAGAIPGAYYGSKLGGRIPTYGNMTAGPVSNFLQQLGPRVGGPTGAVVEESMNPNAP